ncbi:hypothetical protein QYS49_07840 [Marivirga salinae]|uniref:Uncharacterized protein n=1 Tax=Marivirga salinarum TaxID=3059078 RepID=A0AA49JBS4_9BACT|nr:hypothetical protein [Marivirga sp. BDSF4-3]WKK77112.1 hypothetical protein QYS49_07840 [Marivirga sp. BDSF4-3]
MDIDHSFLNFEKSIKKDHLEQVILFQFENFELATQESVDNLKKEYQDAKKQFELVGNKITDVDENNYHKITDEEWERIDEVSQYYQDMDFSREYLESLLEMRIMYLFKNIEVIMKRLIKIAYSDVNTKDFYNWEAMKSFFKSKSINITTLEGYNDCVDCQKLNNSIKHSDTYSDTIYKIPEMSDHEELLHSKLENFYSRVKPKIELFAKELKEAIKNDLYSFSDERVAKIAQEFKDRMDSSTLKKLIHKLE